jgi:cell wall-associated NlpC family hydrolase
MSNRQRESVIAEAKTWLNTPWHHNANLKGVGVDCALFLYAVYLNCGLIEPTNIEPYSRDWTFHNNHEKFLETVENYAHRVDTPAQGDLIMFKTGKTHSHGGIILDYPKIIHAQVKSGVCYANADAGRLVGVERVFYSVFDT